MKVGLDEWRRWLEEIEQPFLVCTAQESQALMIDKIIHLLFIHALFS